MDRSHTGRNSSVQCCPAKLCIQWSRRVHSVLGDTRDRIGSAQGFPCLHVVRSVLAQEVNPVASQLALRGIAVIGCSVSIASVSQHGIVQVHRDGERLEHAVSDFGCIAER